MRKYGILVLLKKYHQAGVMDDTKKCPDCEE